MDGGVEMMVAVVCEGPPVVRSQGDRPHDGSPTRLFLGRSQSVAYTHARRPPIVPDPRPPSISRRCRPAMRAARTGKLVEYRIIETPRTSRKWDRAIQSHSNHQEARLQAKSQSRNDQRRWRHETNRARFLFSPRLSRKTTTRKWARNAEIPGHNARIINCVSGR